MEQPAVVLTDPLAVRPHVVPVPVGPEPSQEARAILAPEAVEQRKLRVGGDRREVVPVSGERNGVVPGGAVIVERFGFLLSGRESGASTLQQPERPVAASGDVALERRGRGVRITGRAFHPSPGQQQVRWRRPRCRDGPPDRVAGHAEAGRVAEPQGQRCQRERRRRVGGIGVERPQVSLRGALQGPESNPAPEREPIGLLRVGMASLGESQGMPGERPVGPPLGDTAKPLDRFPDTGIGAQLGQPELDEAEAQLRQRIARPAGGRLPQCSRIVGRGE
jgi:hypothetical protein